ncbi:FSR family fosmidomycin resistance protein-like MFS transporter [Chromobacterium alkanivorans]|uniref:MFS transporter n=1 Tax=Chromobacterium alkanivorans TaxID=1071719 RepID=UPI0021674B52|nr:MFS transporter [Chromobacterium alkanivorans]MCS3802881.1 FSR family fosmidomycin resistance protein-like MFS transporter [Chromobacterium alkanivorans]MCS3817207.1 FSR family fosmidomycin resistance protein-like MFS transporter [Chromobacterium alkanivorans]MCS3872247.1 FSR family fosmidomycin resistance protein-like MFS transporter [Chromobacterium alkanivorans]
MTTAASIAPDQDRTRFRVLGAISFSHFLNDMLQSLLLAIYPLLKGNYQLSFAEIGLMTLTYQCTASLLQPLVGLYTDKKPMPYSLVLGMGATLCGLLLLSSAGSFPLLLLAAALVGTGSSVFHPESSRVARMASGGRPGLAQSIFQVGGNAGSASGPLLAALIVIPLGQGSIAWFGLAALLAMAVLFKIGQWYGHQQRKTKTAAAATPPQLSPARVKLTLFALLVLLFSKYFYTASITSYFTFYLIQHFGLGVQAAQLHLFLFLLAVALGTIFGGPIGDAIGRKRVIWFSILGIAPLTLLLPYANLFWTSVLSLGIGFVLASAFPAIIIYAQELLPGRVGMVSGMFYGFAFGIGGIGAAVLGQLADSHGIEFVYRLCAFLPLLGLVAALLPDLRGDKV